VTEFPVRRHYGPIGVRTCSREFGGMSVLPIAILYRTKRTVNRGASSFLAGTLLAGFLPCVRSYWLVSARLV
jgi:hypothetical protein